jgi:hypothetical protein
MAAGSSSVCVALFKNTPPIGRENMPNIRIDARIPLGNRLLGSYDQPAFGMDRSARCLFL